MRYLPTLLLAGGMALGCDGAISDLEPPPELQPPTPPVCQGADCLEITESPEPETRIPRLSHGQWENTVRDLFRMSDGPGLARDFDRDTAAITGEFTTTFRRLVMSDGLRQDYQRAAEALAELMVGDEAVARWAPGGRVPGSVEERDAFLRDFGRRALRRPLSEAEVARYGSLYESAAGRYGDLDDARAGLRITLEAMLQSPHFLYRVDLSSSEVTAEDDSPRIEVGPFALATRLSYLLWGSMPDDPLLDAAAAGELDAEGLRAQAERMFEDPRAIAALQQFHTEQFGMASWSDASKEEDVFPDWRPEVATAMVEETQALLNDIVARGGNFRDFLLSRRAFVNEDLARIYGVEGVSGEELQEVELDESRAGLLTRIGFLTHWSAIRQPDPIHRGLFVNVNLLCRDVPEAPPIDFENLAFEGVTNRQRIESVTHEGSCQNCHLEMINPPGFALEHFDAIGAFRATDGGEDVDNTTTFVFPDGDRATVSGGVELSEAVAENRDSHACYSRRLLEYGFGRPFAGGDAPLVYRMAEGSSAMGMSIRELVLELVSSHSFRHRTVENLELDDE